MNNSGPGRNRRINKNKFTTKSGNVIKINRSLGQRFGALKNAKSARKATRKANLPKGRFKRMLYHFQPKRMYHYWFSRDGAIMALKLTGVGLIAGFLILVGLFAYFRKDLPNLRDISGNNIGGSIRYYDRTGQTLLWEDYDAVKRIPVKENEMNKYVRDATVAIEDKDFFKHGGFDVKGIVRAGVNNVSGGSGTQGGSTITQQLVKLTQNWTKDRSYTRKAKELILSVELERSYSKQEILTGYLNTAPYGNVQYGVEAASRDYFQKAAKDLTLDEAVFLAAIPKSPSFYSPYGAYFKTSPQESKEALSGRMQYILKLMQEQGMITKAQKEEASKVDVLAKVKEPMPKFAGIKAPWFVLAAKKQLETERPDTVKVGGWQVTTTLDLDKQKIAEDQIAKGIAQVRRQGGDVAAFAAEDVTTGQMVALVGGVDFTNPEFGQFNYATQPLPPGSSFKPYDYAALIEHTPNVGAGSVLYDTQAPIDGYPCTKKERPKQGGNCLWDYDFRFPGPLTLRYALGGSRNIPAVKAMLTVGIDKTIDTAEKLGLKSGYKCFEDEQNTKEGPCYASSAIGDGAFLHLDEHVHAYGSLSRNGLNIPQTYILKITNANNKVIDEWKPSKGTQAIRPETAYIVDDMLSDPNASYFPAGRKPHRYKNWKFGMKTGTTNDGKDGWMMGMSPKYAAGVWVGYHTRQKVMSGTMEAMTQPIWQGWMDAAHDNIAAFDRPKPAGLQTLPAFVVRTNPGIGAVVPSPSTDLFPSWYKSSAKAAGDQVIDKVSSKLATNCTPERAKEKASNAVANQFSVDKFAPGGAASTSTSNTSDQDDVHKCEDVKPSVSITVTGAPGSYNLSASVTQGTHPISGDKFKGVVNYIVDGQTIKSIEIDGPGSGLAAFTYVPDFTGTKNVYAQVIDSVLYDGSSDAVNVAGTGGGTASGAYTVAATNAGTNKYKFNWSTGGNGVIKIFTSDNQEVCSASAASLGCPGNYEIIGYSGGYARDSGGSGSKVTISGP